MKSQKQPYSPVSEAFTVLSNARKRPKLSYRKRTVRLAVKHLGNDKLPFGFNHASRTCYLSPELTRMKDAPSYAIWLVVGSVEIRISYGALIATLAFLGSLQLPLALSSL